MFQANQIHATIMKYTTATFDIQNMPSWFALRHAIISFCINVNFQTCYLTKFCLLVNSEYSMQLNASRIKVLQAQDDLVNKMKDDAMKELLRVSHNHHEYKNLLKDLIVQVWTNTAYTNFSVLFLKNFYK